MDEKLRRDLIKQIEGYIPDAIRVLEDIIGGEGVDAKTRVRASSTLMRYRDELRKVKQHGGR